MSMLFLRTCQNSALTILLHIVSWVIGLWLLILAFEACLADQPRRA